MQITCSTLSAYRVQHVSHVVRSDSSAVKFDRSLNCIYFSFVLLAEPLTGEGGEETGVPGENP